MDGLKIDNLFKDEIRINDIDKLGQNLLESNKEGTGSMASKLEAAAFAAGDGAQILYRERECRLQ